MPEISPSDGRHVISVQCGACRRYGELREPKIVAAWMDGWRPATVTCCDCGHRQAPGPEFVRIIWESEGVGYSSGQSPGR